MCHFCPPCIRIQSGQDPQHRFQSRNFGLFKIKSKNVTIDRKENYSYLTRGKCDSFFYFPNWDQKKSQHLPRPLLLMSFCFCFLYTVVYGVGTSTLAIHYFCLGFTVWMSLEDDWKLACLLQLSQCDCLELMSKEEVCLSPNGTRAPCLTIRGQYLNVHQRKLGTIIIHTCCPQGISYSIIVPLVRPQAYCPWRTFSRTISSYFQITKPGSVPLLHRTGGLTVRKNLKLIRKQRKIFLLNDGTGQQHRRYLRWLLTYLLVCEL